MADVAELVGRLREHGLTVATAESMTAGGLCATLTTVPGASDVVRGGLIVYATELKAILAGVSRALLTDCGPVHPDVARQLADGARVRCGASWGIGVTGVAGPGPADGVAAGTVHVGLATARESTVSSRVFAGQRNEVRDQAIQLAMGMLREHLSELERSP